MRKIFKTYITIILSLTMIAIGATPAFAGNANTGSISSATVAGTTLANNTTYTVTENCTINAATAGTSALVIPASATVVIYIPEGITLTVKGANGNGKTGGGAGILVPSSSTLIITGGGNLNATGGNGGNGGTGQFGFDVEPNRTRDSNGVYMWWNYYPGPGGPGGAGGGGAGAGIGTAGGTGGNAGLGSATGLWQCAYEKVENIAGWQGGAAGNGQGSENSGTIYALSNIIINAIGGSASTGGSANGNGVNALADQVTGTSGYYAGYGVGGGGGGGGGGGSASGIGAGGGGGSGGSGGGMGGARINYGDAYIDCGWPGLGGVAATGGTNGVTLGISATDTGVNTWSGWWWGRNTGYSGLPGAAGSAGSKGSSGTVYKSTSAAVTGAASTNGSFSTPSALTNNYSIDANSGVLGSMTNIDQTLGVMPGNIVDANLTTKSGYGCTGIYDSVTGGTKYYDASGNWMGGLWPAASAGTLYYQWTPNQYKINYSSNGAISQTVTQDSVYYDGTTSLADSETISKKHSVFMGWNTASDMSGTNYTTSGAYGLYNKQTSDLNLYASWRTKGDLNYVAGVSHPLTISDAVSVSTVASRSGIPTAEELLICDLDNSNDITVRDARYVAMLAANLITFDQITP